MHERPIGDLVDALRQAGAQIRYLGREGFPPLEILPARISVEQPVSVRGEVSSQFLTALLMSLPLTGRSCAVRVEGGLISKPYVEITLNLMARFGLTVERSDWSAFTVPAGRYSSPGAYHVEGDASSASYFLAAGAIGGGPVRVLGVGRDSIQGDVRFADALAALGARIAFGPNWIEAQAPPASTATLVRTVPCSVTTAESRPPSVSMPRAAQDWRIVPPSFRIARATAGAALAGSAVPSVGEKTPPFHGLPVARPRSVA